MTVSLICLCCLECPEKVKENNGWEMFLNDSRNKKDFIETAGFRNKVKI